MSGDEGAPADATVARLMDDLSPRAWDLALQGVAADAGDPFGYLGGLVNMRVLESDHDDHNDHDDHDDHDDAALGAGRWALDVTPNALNRHGYVHGGMLFTLADYAMGVTARGRAPSRSKPRRTT